MSYLVVVTFDIHNGDADDYECVTTGFSKIGLKRAVTQNGSPVDLPENTYVGQYDGPAASNVVTHVETETKKVFNNCRVHGRLFVSAGGDWAYHVTTF